MALFPENPNQANPYYKFTSQKSNTLFNEHFFLILGFTK
ncbi:hypothetical protein HDE70_003215 [Pedobacter cryoconitis]|nr:hypothetical protein [Pedobacter cryoconitis]